MNKPWAGDSWLLSVYIWKNYEKNVILRSDSSVSVQTGIGQQKTF